MEVFFVFASGSSINGQVSDLAADESSFRTLALELDSRIIVLRQDGSFNFGDDFEEGTPFSIEIIQQPHDRECRFVTNDSSSSLTGVVSQQNNQISVVCNLPR